jgi:4-hydroxyphenylpyruvate dioxygenase
LRRSIATVSLSGGLQEKLYAAAAAKFDMVEIFENDLTFYEGTPQDVRESIDGLGLSVSLFQPFTDFEGAPDALFQRNLDRAERKFDLMGELGAQMMLVQSNVSESASEDTRRAAEQLNVLAERAAARGLRIGYQALAWGRRTRSIADAWRLVQSADHHHLGLVLNSFHSLAQGENTGVLGDIPGEKIFLVQLADAPDLEMDLQLIGRHFRCFPGQGGLDILSFARAVIDTGYSGPLSLEVFNDSFRALPARQVAMDAMRSLVFVEERLRRNLTGDEAGKASLSRIELADPPAAPPLEGVAFIEFAVDSASEADLAGWFKAMGFELAGRHKTKDVSLYRQGDVLIVLNASTDSFAHAYYLLHGPSVCAVALKVDDRASLLARADAYGYKRYQERHGPNEHDIPAVRAPDGSLFYLIDDSYDPGRDFEMIAGAQGGSAGLTSVDHIARAVPVGQFDSWLLYMLVLLGLETEEAWDLPEPHGLVRSRALASPDKRVRFPLTFSESNKTLIARSLSTFSGAGVNQIAFASGGIFETVEAMQAAGTPLLAIPPNYYNDLNARVSLPGDVTDRLREHGVLYDRDEHDGEFLHAYTETFHDRFFFEVVQRVGGYGQYGAINAPVRMAAQARPRVGAAAERGPMSVV